MRPSLSERLSADGQRPQRANAGQQSGRTRCCAASSSAHEVKEEPNLRVHEISRVNRQPSAGLTAEVCLAETIAGAVDRIGDVVRQVQRLVRILGDR